MKNTSLLAATLLPFLVFAHPGHGETEGFSIIHYFAEPIHAIVSIGAIVTLYSGYRYFRRKGQKG